MTTSQSIQNVFPQLRITDWSRAHRFYVEGLGFQVDWTHQFAPGMPVFAQVSREGRALFLTEHAGDCQIGGAAYIVLDNLDAFYQEICQRGVLQPEPPEETPWGRREMTLKDPDGNTLRFAAPLEIR